MLHVAGPYIRDGKVAVAAGVLVVVYQGFLVEGYRLGVILQVEGAFPGEGVNVRRRNVALLVLELLPGYPAGFVREVVVVVFQALFRALRRSTAGNGLNTVEIRLHAVRKQLRGKLDVFLCVLCIGGIREFLRET